MRIFLLLHASYFRLRNQKAQVAYVYMDKQQSAIGEDVQSNGYLHQDAYTVSATVI